MKSRKDNKIFFYKEGECWGYRERSIKRMWFWTDIRVSAYISKSKCHPSREGRRCPDQFPVVAAMTSGEGSYATYPWRLRAPNHKENGYGAQRGGCTPTCLSPPGVSSPPPLLFMYSFSPLTATNLSAHWNWHISPYQNGKGSRFCLNLDPCSLWLSHFHFPESMIEKKRQPWGCG